MLDKQCHCWQESLQDGCHDISHTVCTLTKKLNWINSGNVSVMMCIPFTTSV